MLMELAVWAGRRCRLGCPHRIRLILNSRDLGVAPRRPLRNNIGSIVGEHVGGVNKLNGGGNLLAEGLVRGRLVQRVATMRELGTVTEVGAPLSPLGREGS